MLQTPIVTKLLEIKVLIHLFYFFIQRCYYKKEGLHDD